MDGVRCLRFDLVNNRAEFGEATNATVITSLCLSALSVSGAIQVSSAPLRAALAHLGQ